MGVKIKTSCFAVLLVVAIAWSVSDAHGQTPGQIPVFGQPGTGACNATQSNDCVDSAITQDGSGNIGIGTTTPAAALDVATGNLNIAGNLLKGGTLFLHNSGFENTFLGQNSGNLSMTGMRNTAAGSNTLLNNVSGNNNTAVGTSVLFANTSGCCNTASGTNALWQNTTGGANTASGDGALYSNATGSNNTAIGRWALISNDIGDYNTALGASALQNNTGFSGTGNTALGFEALFSNRSGFNNTASGIKSLYNNTSGDNNMAAGFQALISNTTGFNNTACGNASLNVNTTGSFNTGLGWGASVALGNFTNSTAIGANAVVTASNKVRLGDNHVTVVEGPVPYTFVSDRNRKENFQPVDGDAILSKIGGMSLASWNYIGHDPQQFRHYGPVAQEFFAAFGHDTVGIIGSPTTINSGDMEGILMIAVQALEKRTAENADLKARIEALETIVKIMRSEQP